MIPILAALSFLTIAGRGTPPDRRSLPWFGPVGVLVGGMCGLVRWGAGTWWAPAVAAALTVAADLVLTGALHVDGLADTADGVLPHLDREQRLAVMAAPDVGAFAVAVVAVTLLLRWSALATMDVAGWRWISLLGGVWCGGRVAMVAMLGSLPYARPEGGLARAFVGASAGPGGSGGLWTAVAVGTVLCGLGVAAGAGIAGIAAVGAGALAAAGVAALSWRRLGGFTGDVLGAAGLVLETVALVVVAASW